MFTIIDRYILKQISLPLVAAMSIGLLVLLAERMVRLLETTLGKKNSFAVVFELLAYLVPHYLGLAIPAALFLGLLFGFSKLSRDSELDAFFASGAGLARLTRPAVLLACGIALLSFTMFGWLQPYTRYAFRAVLFDVAKVDVFYLAEEGVFMQSGTRTFILDELDRGQSAFDRIFLFDYRGAGGSETVTATRGTLVQIPGERRPVLQLSDGHRLILDKLPDPASPAQPPSADVTSFQTANTPVGKKTDTAFHERGQDEHEMTLPELLAFDGQAKSGTNPVDYTIELHKRIINIVTPIMLPFLAIPFALGRRRSRRAYQFGAALVILVVLHELVEQGALTSNVSGISPWISMWLPFLAVSAFAAWRFWRVSFHLPSGRIEDKIDDWADAIAEKTAALLRRAGFKGAS